MSSGPGVCTALELSPKPLPLSRSCPTTLEEPGLTAGAPRQLADTKITGTLAEEKPSKAKAPHSAHQPRGHREQEAAPGIRSGTASEVPPGPCSREPRRAEGTTQTLPLLFWVTRGPITAWVPEATLSHSSSCRVLSRELTLLSGAHQPNPAVVKEEGASEMPLPYVVSYHPVFREATAVLAVASQWRGLTLSPHGLRSLNRRPPLGASPMGPWLGEQCPLARRLGVREPRRRSGAQQGLAHAPVHVQRY